MPTLQPDRAVSPKLRRPCADHGDLRCGCGSLLARVVGETVELKCRRCKQTWRIPIQPAH
ncbi:hypothetical protein [Anaeromyxobacter paludicola]|uniref:Com family DNA-binding transcriptional regulator n=1 Tax=Anaeromyxobacter paludicola TaxID=2918171 RepID=A0ABM7XEE3_9BACT|nr:hypothetical protein [Anaeromyxobacter paludicola]BDG10263.1 hypothetical protein AMPC_33760 [Anaeromyxobacter paludicola]